MPCWDSLPERVSLGMLLWAAVVFQAAWTASAEPTWLPRPSAGSGCSSHWFPAGFSGAEVGAGICSSRVCNAPWANQSRRWLGRSPHGSSVRDVQTYTQRQTASRCLSETHDTLPRSAIWCLVPWSCWQPSETLADAVQRRWANWRKTVWWEQGWLMVIQDKKIPQHNTEETEAKIFSVSPQCKWAASPFGWCILGDVY